MLPPRFVDSEEKAQLVSKESKTWSTDEYYSQGTTMATNRLIDVVATRQKHSSLVMDMSRAILHLVEDDLVLVDLPKMWKGAGSHSWKRSCTVVENDTCFAWTPERTLRMASFFWQQSRSVSWAGAKQKRISFHSHCLWASGPFHDLEKLMGDVSTQVSVKHAMIFRAGKSATCEYLRRERIFTPEGCYVRANSQSVERAVRTLQPTTGMISSVVHGIWTKRLLLSTVVSLVLSCTWDMIEAMQPIPRELATFCLHGDGHVMKELGAHTGSAWAGDLNTGKRTSCAVLQVDGCQSSSEAKVHAAVMGLKELRHFLELLSWNGEPMRARWRMHSAACRSVLLRVGVRQIRHLEVNVFWAQGQPRSGRLVVEKCDGSTNVSDIGTMPLSATVFEWHRDALGLIKPCFSSRT